MWGLPLDEVKAMPETFENYFDGFSSCFQTRTHNGADHAFAYLLGLISLDSNRNYVNISRRVNGVRDSGQNIQHFVSDSPWPHRRVYEEIQRQIGSCEQLRGGFLTVDDSQDARSCGISAGVARQRNGRLGKVDSCQSGVGLTYQKDGISVPIDAELFLQARWFTDEYRALWPKLHIPCDLEPKTKVQMALEMILRAKGNGLEFTAVCGDDLYGRSCDFRQGLNENGILYVCDVPGGNRVYLEEPVLRFPGKYPGPPCPNFKKCQCVTGTSYEISSLVKLFGLEFERVGIRPAERGILRYSIATVPCWTVTNDGRKRSETLLVRKESNGRFSYSLSNAPVDVARDELARWRAHRYFVERTFQDCKTELGWDELCAVKYRAWAHHTALVALALWLVTKLRLGVMMRAVGNGSAMKVFEVEHLPPISVSCLRLLLRTVYGLLYLAWEEALHIAMIRQAARIRSRKSRLRSQHVEKPGKEDFL
jgi:SRSO17 transposase